jgi:hypothetical protein
LFTQRFGLYCGLFPYRFVVVALQILNLRGFSASQDRKILATIAKVK